MIQADPGARLSVSISNGMSVEVRLGLREVRIGRSREAELQLPDPSVSRLHARIFRVGAQYFLADLGSRNGTHAGGKRVTQLPLEDGQTFHVGPFQIHFHRGAPLPPSGEEPTISPSAGDGAPFRTSRQEVTGCVVPAPSSKTRLAPYGLVGESHPIRGLVSTIRRVAASDVPVLIEGETGCGKELVARGIHDASDRRDQPFIVVNCGAISPDLIESELFGHEKGAFTGATAQRKGAFELAHRGTIFLDEIGELPFLLQPKLLRVLEQKEVKRVGGNETLTADVRILAATNRNLREEIGRKAFREDLYYRVGAVTVEIPPLRSRREDIAPITRHFLREMAARSQRPLPELTPEALELLVAYEWPGNVRELRNAVQRAVVMTDGARFSADDFSFLVKDAPAGREHDFPPGLSRWERAERVNLLAELARQGGNKTRTAKELGIAKSTLFEKLKKYAISPADPDR